MIEVLVLKKGQGLIDWEDLQKQKWNLIDAELLPLLEGSDKTIIFREVKSPNFAISPIKFKRTGKFQ